MTKKLFRFTSLAILFFASLVFALISSCSVVDSPFDTSSGNAQSRAAGANLLANPGFETSAASGWTETLSASIYSFEATAAGEYKSGAQARGYWLNSGSTGTVELKQTVNVSAGTYSAKVWTRLDGSSATAKTLKIIQGGVTKATATLPVGGSYAQSVLTGLSLSAGSATFQINYTVPNGNVYLTVDDAEFFNENSGGTTTTTVSGTTTTVASGNTVYVTSGGNDTTGNGSSGNPYRTVFKAASVATSGKTINVGSGTFNETQVISIPLGVSVQGAGANNTTISHTSLTASGAEDESGFFIRLSSGSMSNGNQTLTAFKVDGRSRAFNGIFVQNRNNVTINNVSISNTYAAGARVFATNSSAINMTGIVLSNMTLTNTSRDFDFNGNGSFDAGDWSSGAINIGGLDGALVYGITINESYGYGIKFTNNGYLKNTKIYNSTITVNESDALWGEDIAIELWNMGPGNEIYNVSANTWFSLVNHPGVYASPSTAGENIKVYNNRIVDLNASSGKEAIELAVPGVAVYDNLFQNKGFGMAIWDAGGYRVLVRNNIFYNSPVQVGSWGADGALFIANSTGRTYSDINIYNNVFDRYTNALTLINSGSGSINGVNIKNNVFMNVTGKHLIGAGTNVVFQYNQTTNTLNQTGATSVSNNYVSSTTGFNASGDRLTNWYKPSSGSAYVVNKGTDLGYGDDLGAYQWTGGGTTSTTVGSTTTSSTVASTTTSSTSTTVGSTTTSTTIAGSLAAGTYRIVNKFSNKSLRTNSYTSGLFNATWDSSSIMKWTVTKVGSYYKLQNVSNGYFVSAMEYGGPTHASGGSSDAQQFNIVSVGGGYYKISLKSYSARFWRMDDLYDGNNVGLANWSDEDRFKFQFIAQ